MAAAVDIRVSALLRGNARMGGAGTRKRSPVLVEKALSVTRIRHHVIFGLLLVLAAGAPASRAGAVCVGDCDGNRKVTAAGR